MVSTDKIGERLKRLRGKRRREDVAKAVHISVSALQMYEDGRRVPRDEIKVALAMYYGVGIEQVFFAD